MSILARTFWKSYWIALQRIGKDKRARSYATRVSFFLIYLIAYALFVGYMASDSWNGIFYAFIFGSGTVAALLMRRWHRKQDEVLNFSLTGQSRAHPQDASIVSSEIRIYLEERALILASLVVRGGSEAYLHRNDLGAGLEIVTRQTQNCFLREHRLWEKLERIEFSLASLADGQWTEEQYGRLVDWSEQVRLLRWILKVDSEIVPLAHYPRLDFSLASELLERAGHFGGAVLTAWEVRVQRDIAMEYTARVLAEMKARSLVPGGPELEGWADEFRAKSLGASSDYLAGPRTIAELDDNELRLLGSLAAARFRYAGYLVDQLNSVQVVPYSVWHLEN